MPVRVAPLPPIVAAVGLILTAATAVAAQSVSLPTASTPISVEVRHTVADTVAAQIERRYVDADTGRMIAGIVRGRLGAGAYDTLADPAAFAKQLTLDLRSVNHDLHLSVAFTGGGTTGAPRRSALDFLGRDNHFALGRVEVLPGNVGYFEINGFSNDTAARSAIVAALQYLSTTDAVILDLRKNRGGDGNTVNFLISHFTAADPQASVTVKTRNGGATTRYTLLSVPGPRRAEVPLYVLTSRSTGSAGEDCAFVLKNLHRATVIGDRTAGAGHNVAFVSSGYGFTTGISFSRVSDPRTGQEWEQVGVQPDVKVDPAAALDSALAMIKARRGDR